MQVEDSSVDESHMSRVFNIFNRSDWINFVAGILAALALGAQMPGYGLALTGIMTTYYEPDPDDIKAGGRYVALTADSSGPVCASSALRKSFHSVAVNMVWFLQESR